MANQIDNEMKKTIKIVIHNAKFVFFTCDEVTSMKNASWTNVHCIIHWTYLTVQTFSHLPLASFAMFI
jgi:hypothetical protein